MASFQMGPGTLAVPMKMFYDNRSRVCESLRATETLPKNAYVLLEGGKDANIYDTDTAVLFRMFVCCCLLYMFGVKEPDCSGVVNATTSKATLFVPRLAQDYATWMGRLLSLDEFKSMYEVDEVLYVDQLDAFFGNLRPLVILTLYGKNYYGSMSKPAHFEGIEKYIVDQDILHPVITECRVIKSVAEIEVLRYVAKISSEAHIRVMQYMRPGRTEYQGEARFLHYTYAIGGCRHVSYTCICGSGTNSAILHYGHAAAPNDKVVQDGDLCLFDMGANYCGYAADITCTFPANGKFTQHQKFIYNAVLAARNAVIEKAPAGIIWSDMHTLANRVMLQQLINGGMLKGNVNDMLTAGLANIFQPHGLGHLLGLDVHDVGGYTGSEPKVPDEPFFRSLRFGRILKAGMYVTVEPGCYFIDWLMDKALADIKLRRFINVKVFERFRKFGGVRIEDDILILEDGNENFTYVPRTIKEIERVVRGEDFKVSYKNQCCVQ